MLDYKSLIEKYFTIYIQGNSGLGKTKNLIEYLEANNYEYKYNSVQQMKSEEELVCMMNERNIMRMFQVCNDKNKKKCIVIDDIDYLHNSDKKFISAITKLLKTKNINVRYPGVCIIFVGTNKTDKKVIELIAQVDSIQYIEDETDNGFYDKKMKEVVNDILEYNYDKTKDVHSDKTIISLCYHENISSILNADHINQYDAFLRNICKGDFYDRIAFQKQLWQFNEMTYFIKVLHNYDLMRSEFQNATENNINEKEIIFTKILTKYSNEYSNLNFIINMCTKFNIQKSELFEAISKRESGILDLLTPVEERRLTKLCGIST